jgi:hypothetical protein
VILARASDALIAGIANSGLRDGDTGRIENSVSRMDLGDNGFDRAYLGGIWVNRPSRNAGTVMTIENCLFAGDTAALESGSSAQDIYNCDIGNATGVNNHTARPTATPTSLDPTGAEGRYTDVLDRDENGALTWYDGTLGLDIADSDPGKTGEDSPAWHLEDIGIGGPYLPKVATAYRWPAQRIYVTDYYHQNNFQEFISQLYLWNGSAFVSLWTAGTQISGSDADDPLASVDFYMPPSQHAFVFYYKVPNIQEEPTLGAWQNTVKITPRDNVLIFEPGDTAKSNPKLDWPGDYDDDWVYTEDEAPDYKLNLIKMTSVSNYPRPLDGAEFTLYTDPDRRIYDDFSSVTYSAWPSVTLNPSGYLGLEESDWPEITTGSYVLVETDTPAHYGSNQGRIWYLVFSGGELRMYAQADLDESSRVPLGEQWLPGSPETLVYAAQIENPMDPGTPLARIYIEKYNEDGSQAVIGGMTELSDGSLVFTGAVYGLRKFAGPGFTGESAGYGNMLVYGYDLDGATMLQNWGIIEPGCYELVEIRAPQGYVTDPTPI